MCFKWGNMRTTEYSVLYDPYHIRKNRQEPRVAGDVVGKRVASAKFKLLADLARFYRG